nr:small integral membrane protein 8 isoform X2 [Oryctolagus cuniculus]
MGYRHCRTDILAMADDYTAFSTRKTLSVLQSPLESRLLLKLQGNKSSVKMSSAPEPPAFKKEPPKEKDFQNPGLRGVRTTTLFRAVNPELFIKPMPAGWAKPKPRTSIYISHLDDKSPITSLQLSSLPPIDPH